MLVILIPFFLFVSAFFPQTHGVLVSFWILSIVLDLFSTYKFYLQNPNKFAITERNKVFIYLTKKLGFKKAAATFPIIFELPLLLFLATVPLQTLYTYLFPDLPVNFNVCLAASLAIAATGHLQATSKNLTYKKTNNQLTPSHLCIVKRKQSTK